MFLLDKFKLLKWREMQGLMKWAQNNNIVNRRGYY